MNQLDVFGSFKPALARFRTAFATAFTASSCPITRECKNLFHVQQSFCLFLLPVWMTGTPVQLDYHLSQYLLCVTAEFSFTFLLFLRIFFVIYPILRAGVAPYHVKDTLLFQTPGFELRHLFFCVLIFQILLSIPLSLAGSL